MGLEHSDWGSPTDCGALNMYSIMPGLRLCVIDGGLPLT